MHLLQIDYPSAIADIDQALKLDSTNSLYYLKKMEILVQRKMWDEAVAVAAEGLRVCPKYKADLYGNRAGCELIKGDYRAALADLDNAVREAPEQHALPGRPRRVVGDLFGQVAPRFRSGHRRRDARRRTSRRQGCRVAGSRGLLLHPGRPHTGGRTMASQGASAEAGESDRNDAAAVAAAEQTIRLFGRTRTTKGTKNTKKNSFFFFVFFVPFVVQVF